MMATPAVDTIHLPKISVVIASFNSESRSYLRRCLESIKSQEYSGEVEIIVVDGGSTDESVSISLAHGARVIYNPNITELGFAGGKNLGINNSTGEFIAIVDADNILMNQDYLTKMIQPFMLGASSSSMWKRHLCLLILFPMILPVSMSDDS